MKVSYLYEGYKIIKDTESAKFPYSVYLNEEYKGRSKSIQDAKNKINSGVYLDDYDDSSIEDFCYRYGDEYSWISTLEEDLLEEDWFNENNTPNSREYNVKDIVMVTLPESGVHRILIITKIKKKDGEIQYGGFLLSSQINKSNKVSKYTNNIYINNYGTILASGNKIDKEAIIKVDKINYFTKNNFSSSGTYKGTVTDEFFNFIMNCKNNYDKHISNKNMSWEK